jgi:peptidyl-tRNA hydrolase, PTH1 family
MFFHTEKPEIIVLGLGNPGKEYAMNRHNIGWSVAKAMSDKFDNRLKNQKQVCKVANVKISGINVALAVPTTFMNRSGIAADYLLHKYNLKPENLLVIVDEYNFPVGKLHLKTGGSAGGHNGIASIAEEIDTESFFRLRCGIGKNFAPGGMVDYVLGDFLSEEIIEKNTMISHAIDAVEYFVTYGSEKAMSVVNSEELWA